MNIRTLCLNLIIILSTLSPVLLVGIIFNFPGMDKKKKNDNVFFGKVICYVLLVISLFICTLDRSILEFKLPKDKIWYLIALVAVPITISIEILIGIIFVKLKGKKVKKISFWAKGEIANNKFIFITIVVGLLEEIIFRKTWFSILLGGFSINIYVVLAITSIAYGLNHLFMGRIIIVQKIVAGIIYGSLYILSGSLLIPILTHCIENFIVTRRGDGK